MSRSLRVCQASIDNVKLSVRRSGFPSQRALAEEIGLSLATISNFLTGKPVDRATFLELCDKLSLDADAIADRDPEPTDPLSQRTLAAIVFTDVVSSTQRMATNERHTLTLMQQDFQQMRTLCQQSGGRVLKNLGDGLLLYFHSAEQAVSCAIAIQQTLRAIATELPPEGSLQHRIGIDLGDVVYGNNDVMGNCVNMAARLQAEAEPGSICLSQSVYDVVKSHLPVPIRYAGERHLKGLPDPSPIYQIDPLDSAPSSSPQPGLPLSAATATPAAAKQDWGEAMDVSIFYGRATELTTLTQWIAADRCRLITLIGMGGIGKTALAIKLAEQVQAEFDYVIWRSLRNAPPLLDLLADLLNVLSRRQQLDLPEAIGGRITRLIEHLRMSRCLLVLDNAESILSTGDSSADKSHARAGAYREGYEVYAHLFQSVGEGRHQSCLVVTSREKPSGLTAKEGKTSPIRSLRLAGLDPNNAQAMLEEKGVSILATDGQALIDHYSGNPLALKIVATTIQELFDGDVAQFLAQGTAVFGDISDLLEQQFNRLTQFEQQVMYWLAINREWVSLAELRTDILSTTSPRLVLDALDSLRQRSLIEKATATAPDGKVATFTQQPVVMEYVSDCLIERVCDELMYGDITLIDSHALSKAQTKDYLRHTQARLLLTPVIDRLQQRLGTKALVTQQLNQTLSILKARSAQPPGYAAGNLLNLLNRLDINLSGYDFSHLTVWQVYLQGVNLHRVNFAHADLTRSVFTQTLGDVLAIAFSPSSALLATGIDRDILLWRIAERRQIATFEGHTAWVRCVAYSPDGNLLASGSNDQTIRLWDVQTGQCLKTLHGHTSGIQTLAFSPDGTLLASGSHEPTICVWDVKTHQCIKTLKGHGDRILTVIFTPDHQTLISTSDDQTIRVWNLTSGECIQTIATHVNWMLSTALSPDGKTLVTGSDRDTVKFWNVQTGNCVATLPDYHATVWAIAFSPDGQLLATGSDDKTVRLWDVETRQCLRILPDHQHQVWLVSFSADGRLLVSGGEDQTVRLWDVELGQCLTTIKSYRNWVAAVAFSSDDRILASGSKDQLVRLWDVETGVCTHVQKGHSDVVTAVAFNPAASVPLMKQTSSSLLASASDDHTIKLWHASTLDYVKTLAGHTGWVQAIAFSPTGQTLASASSDKTVKLWEVRSGECLHTWSEHTHRVTSVAFHPQGLAIASGSDDHTVKLWAVSTGTCVRTLHGHTDRVRTVAYSPDGTRLASGSGDRSIKLWDLQSGQCLHTLAQHTQGVRSLAFSPDGLTLASGGEDCLVKLWDVTTATCRQTLHGHDQVVWMVTFNHKGRIIASCSDDGTIRLWDSKTGEPMNSLSADRPYEGMTITGAIGLTSAQRATLCALGAIAE